MRDSSTELTRLDRGRDGSRRIGQETQGGREELWLDAVRSRGSPLVAGLDQKLKIFSITASNFSQGPVSLHLSSFSACWPAGSSM